MLRGEHLRVFEMEWSIKDPLDPSKLMGYAIKDPTAAHNWTGFDIDLFSAVADKLGFTFEISETPMLPGETYTQMLLRTISQTDLWLSWWLRSQERMDGAAMLFGHVDASPVLISPPPKTAGSESLWGEMDNLFKPFSWPLWGCIGAMILCQ